MRHHDRARCIILLTALVFVALPGCSRDATVLTGLVDAVEVDVASKVPGRVEKLFVEEGQAVNAGDPLATIAREMIDAKLDQVDAAIDAAQSQLTMANNGAREEQKRAAKRQMEAARHQVEITKKMRDRMAKLLEQKALPRARFEEFEFKYNVSVEQFEMARAGYDAVMKGARDEQVDALRALVRRAKAVRSEVQDYEKEMAQNSPLTGEVAKVHLHPGELAATGFPILTIVDSANPYVVFSLREDLLRDVGKGKKITAYAPALDREIQLEVTHIAPLGDFADWRATAERDNFDLKSFEIRAKPVEPVKGLRPGMTVRWTVE